MIIVKTTGPKFAMVEKINNCPEADVIAVNRQSQMNRGYYKFERMF